MKKRSVRKTGPLVLVAMCVLAFGFVPGCGDTTVVSESQPPPGVVKTPDQVERGSRSVASLYLPGNPYVTRSIDEMLARPRVSSVVDRFEARGFELRRDESLVMEESGPDGDARVVIMSMPPLAPGLTETVMLACVEQNGMFTVASGMFTSSPGENPGDYLRLSDSLWFDRTPLGPELSPADVEQMDDAFWAQVMTCFQVRAPSAAATCFVTCVPALEGYIMCVVACFATQYLVGFVQCYVSVAILSGRWPLIPTMD